MTVYVWRGHYLSLAAEFHEELLARFDDPRRTTNRVLPREA